MSEQIKIKKRHPDFLALIDKALPWLVGKGDQPFDAKTWRELSDMLVAAYKAGQKDARGEP